MRARVDRGAAGAPGEGRPAVEGKRARLDRLPSRDAHYIYIIPIERSTNERICCKENKNLQCCGR